MDSPCIRGVDRYYNGMKACLAYAVKLCPERASEIYQAWVELRAMAMSYEANHAHIKKFLENATGKMKPLLTQEQ